MPHLLCADAVCESPGGIGDCVAVLQLTIMDTGQEHGESEIELGSVRYCIGHLTLYWESQTFK